MRRKKEKKKFADGWILAVMVAALMVLVYAGCRLAGIWQEYKAGETEYKNLQTYVQLNAEIEEKKSMSDEADTAKEKAAPVTVDFESLQKVNEDIVAWLYAEAIPEISYPVVQGEDNEFYLHHTAEKKKNSSAAIFLDYRNSAAFTDPMTLIYGHNMKDKSMFGRLKQYRKEDVYGKSPYIWILTPEKTLKYEILSVRMVNEKDALYSLVKDNGQKTGMEEMQKKSLVPTTVTYDGSEPMLTLSTCTGKSTERCVVQAVLKEEETE